MKLHDEVNRVIEDYLFYSAIAMKR